MPTLFAPNLPLRIEGCAICAALPPKGITKPLIDAYVQHHRDLHGWTYEIGWRQTYEWAYGPDWRTKIDERDVLLPSDTFLLPFST